MFYAPKICCTPETLRVWIHQHEWDMGTVMVAECQRLKVPERENCEVRRSNDMVGPV
ncbi:hypothetical protein ACLB1E_35620 [Escherichia coli]